MPVTWIRKNFNSRCGLPAPIFSLLAAQRIKISQQKNLERADALRLVVLARTKNGLNPGVDSSQANAEVSNAKIALTNAINYEAEQASQLALLMGITYREFVLDTVFINRIPASFYDFSPRERRSTSDTEVLSKSYRCKQATGKIF